VPFAAWQKALCGVLAAQREFTPLVLASSLAPRRNTRANIQGMHFDASQLRRALAPTGVACPSLDRQLIGTYVDAMVRENPLQTSEDDVL
jgi:hypothetical protein